MPRRRPPPKRRREPAGAAVLQVGLTSAIRQAALRELAEVGYRGMSMEAVARRAGVGKAALYRRWPSKQVMIAALVSDWGAEAAETADTGSLRGDLEAFLQRTLRLFGDPLMSRIFPELVAEGQRNPPLATALRTGLQRRRREAGRRILDRALVRGELGASTDIELALDFMAAPLFWRTIVTNGEVSDGYVPRLADRILLALEADEST
jgi:AcrR family transcriptional regulator